MTLLTRYLFRQNLFLLFTILLVGTGLYVLTDVFERLDIFLESGTSAGSILFFFALKIPTIISLILPAVYLIALVVQLNILDRNREIIALTAGGISPGAFIRFIIFYGIMWALLQLAFAQFFSVQGEKEAARMWQEDVRGRTLEDAALKGLWFTENANIVHIGLVYPVQKKGRDILIYRLNKDNSGIETITRAKTFIIDTKGKWTLFEGSQLVPSEYTSTPFDLLTVPLNQDLRAFQVWSSSSAIRPTHLSLFELHDTITRLEQAGSNVERLLTAWHGKLAYACSIFIMGLLAYIVSRLTSNIYLAIVSSLLIVFFYYTINTLSGTLGEKGVVAPVIAAWFANALFAFFCFAWIFRTNILSLFRSSAQQRKR